MTPFACSNPRGGYTARNQSRPRLVIVAAAILLAAGCAGSATPPSNRPAPSVTATPTTESAPDKYERGRVDVGFEIEVNVLLIRLKLWGNIQDAEFVAARAYNWTADKAVRLFAWTGDGVQYTFGTVKGWFFPKNKQEEDELRQIKETRAELEEKLKEKYAARLEEAKNATTDEQAKAIEEEVKKKITEEVEAAEQERKKDE
jgi:hypothetical protein